MKYEIISEKHPEKFTSILKCKVWKWHSFFSGASEIKEFLAISGKKTNDEGFQVYEAPDFIRLSEWEEDRIWTAMKIFRKSKKAIKARQKVQEEYGEYISRSSKSPLKITGTIRMPKKKTVKQRWAAMKQCYRLYRVKEYGVIRSSIVSIGIFMSLDDQTEKSLRKFDNAQTECCECSGEGIIDFTDSEWEAMYGVPLSGYEFTGKEPETMKTCPNCNGLGMIPPVPLL